MAGKFTDEQVSEIGEALNSLTDGAALSDPWEIIGCLRDSKQTAFTGSELDSIAAAISALEQPLDQKPRWKAAPSRGQFFVFEGLDRSGKSTQSKRLTKHLEESGSVKWMCFPNRETPAGILIDLYLRNKIELHDKTVHKLFSANRWETAASIVDDLNQGTSVVCDRYAFSGVAYSASKGLDFEWCQSTDFGLPVPDSVFYLFIDEKVGASRANFGDERYENAEMQARVRLEFTQPALRAEVAWYDVDGARDIDTIHAEIRGVVQDIREKEKENGSPTIRRLWVA